MPIFMDLHIAPGVTAREVAEAHLLDVKIQDKYSCKAMTYWLDPEKGCVFCLIEAPDKESVREMHAQAHGLIPNEIILVNTDLVKAFLGRIQDPENATRLPESDIKVFSDSAFRILMTTKTTDTRLLQYGLGKERGQELLHLYNAVVREESRNHGGGEVYRKEEGFVVSYVSHSQALACSMAIQKKLQASAATIGLRIALHGGVPVDKDDTIFGTTIRFSQFMCTIGKPGEVSMSAVVRNLFKADDWSLKMEHSNLRCLAPADETFLISLLHTLAANWQTSEFDVPDFCRIMSLSKSQLYRKCINSTGMSPNILLREYRLLRSLELLRDEQRNIAQTTFDVGFGSPSYFTKCFQKRFGLQPLAYMRARV